MTNQVLNYISKYWSYDINKLTINKSLDDLGMYGDDKYDFIIDFAKAFNLNINEFPFDKYIEDEGDFFGIGAFIKKNIFNKKSRDIKPITISMLLKWVESNKFER